MFRKPIETLDREVALANYQRSSRLDAFINKTSKSIGASCNYFNCDDSISSIGDAKKWALEVLAYQGAPSIEWSNLREEGSAISTGGTSSGAVSFMLGFDMDVHIMRRAAKKNGAGISYLDYKHPELDKFLELPCKSMYKGVFIPMHGTKEAKELLENRAMVEKLANAYNNFKCFLVKRPLPYKGVPLGVNLCTEVTIPHKGFCIIGAINLASTRIKDYPRVFRAAAEDLLMATYKVLEVSRGTYLYCEEEEANRQFGLGVYGLATVLGKIGSSYEELADTLALLFEKADDIAGLVDAASYLDMDKTINYFVYYLLRGYLEATKVAKGKVRAAFCIQPTVSTAKRSVCLDGYYASPEIAPVEGIRYDHAVSTVSSSHFHGNRIIDYHPATLTMADTTYYQYARVSALFQRIMESTELAHRHSHCFYGEKFTTEDFKRFYEGENRYIQSLYYRLTPHINREAMDKTGLWQEVEEGELFDGDLSFLQNRGNISCDCEM